MKELKSDLLDVFSVVVVIILVAFSGSQAFLAVGSAIFAGR